MAAPHVSCLFLFIILNTVSFIYTFRQLSSNCFGSNVLIRQKPTPHVTNNVNNKQSCFITTEMKGIPELNKQIR